MHMADALISPAVGGTMWAVSGSIMVYCAKRLRKDLDDRMVPLMGVLGAFIFAAQMINFTIPATGSSGHIGGGMMLAILLGPHAAFLVMASILTVQALFFADGGLLALGCNIFNLGFFPCFIAYPFIFKKITGAAPAGGRLVTGAVLASIIGLQLGAFAVVLETLASGVSALPFTTFVLLMQPIHLGIGVVEGLATAAIITFVWKARPEILETASGRAAGTYSPKQVIAGLAVAALVTGGVVSWFASAHPDGLEWAMFHTAGTEELEPADHAAYGIMAGIQEKTAFLPDYGFRAASGENDEKAGEEPWPGISTETTLSGIVGGMLTLILAGLIGVSLRFLQRSRGTIRRA